MFFNAAGSCTYSAAVFPQVDMDKLQLFVAGTKGVLV